MKLRNIFASRLRTLMGATTSLDTQARLSKKAKVSQSTIARVLSGDTSPTLDTVERVAVAFGVAPIDLLGELNGEEISLLSMWRKVSDADRERAFSFLRICAVDHPVVAEQPQSLDYTSGSTDGLSGKALHSLQKSPSDDEITREFHVRTQIGDRRRRS